MIALTDYPPDLYDAVHTGNAGDAEFYEAACAGTGAVLELGCGTGRVGARLVRGGHEVVGIDLNRSALGVARAKRLVVLRADMRAFRIRRRFERIIVPYNGMYCLLDEDDLVRCLRRAREHLTPRGLLVFDGYAMDDWHADRDPVDVDFTPEDPVATVELAGRRFDVFEETRWEPLHQRVDVTYRHVPADGGAPVVVHLPQRYVLAPEVPALLARAGLRLASLHGDFDESRFEAGCPHLVVRARPE